MNVVQLLTEHLARLFDWVCSVSIMATILVALILVLQYILKDRLKPRWLYLMWLLVILRLVLPWGPESEISIYNWIGYPELHSSDAIMIQGGLTSASPSDSSHVDFKAIIAVIWALGVCVGGIYAGWVNWNFARKIRKNVVAVTDARVEAIFHECHTMMGGHLSTQLVQSSRLETPALYGFRKPVVIIPHTLAETLNDEQLQHVFLHELAHRKRNDIKVNALMYVLLIIHWFNPVLWYAYRRMQDDQEVASDALALSYLPSDRRQAYGYTLIRLLERISQPVQTVGHVNLIGNKVQLQRRMRMIKQFKPKSYGWSFLGLAIMLMISGCTLTSPKQESSSVPLASSPVTDLQSTSGETTKETLKETSTATDAANSKDQQQKDATTVVDSTPHDITPGTSVTQAANSDSKPVPNESPAPAVELRATQPASAQTPAPVAVPGRTEDARKVPTAVKEDAPTAVPVPRRDTAATGQGKERAAQSGSLTRPEAAKSSAPVPMPESEKSVSR
ncbi:M56 family metallopeptidase [Paenibacillus whitsoniae]|uniref:Peptidase M56 domain-containing protein n=1 Tax=Paenibacillus whitsoniae TaxID=2496558 RepID=A0A430JGL7_9BACL|nr:M56 family metallopeptidase [Paenibacillus whitsoniae]RTE10161.1 hypothetical protein EJQ19_08325 [Paenibacillus whitsoniae]